MRYHILRVLEPVEARNIATALETRSFVDGKATATGLAAKVKNNLQAERSGPEPTDLDQQILAALRKNAALTAFAYPKLLALPHFARYEPGMEYGTHIDSAVMGTAGGSAPFRTDLAITLFLSPPDSYDGGELVIQENMGEEEIKLDAGEAIFYSANSLHRVAPVTRGVRLVAITWIQSAVADERIRAILFDQRRAIEMASPTTDASTQLLLEKCHQNLLRLVITP